MKLNRFLTLVLFLGSLCGCSSESNADSKKVEEHECVFSRAYYYDSAGHFHKCLVKNCKKTSIEEAHTFSEWTLNRMTFEDEYRVCSVCKYSEQRKIDLPTITTLDEMCSYLENLQVVTGTKVTLNVSSLGAQEGVKYTNNKVSIYWFSENIYGIPNLSKLITFDVVNGKFGLLFDEDVPKNKNITTAFGVVSTD